MLQGETSSAVERALTGGHPGIGFGGFDGAAGRFGCGLQSAVLQTDPIYWDKFALCLPPENGLIN